ncbi:Hypothetical predicted protein [Mytilus galloprovincialis]|uniref:Uncharacterized protein n=1 Tax=Mytilus galloprovincialis TaxID=29158 RepID=A0A8B6DI85_MYTGA|nr:Hypothetical predicted protein [Mytilus galloprovincialis]
MEDTYPQLRSQVCEMSLEDIILESDAPYLHPKNYEDSFSGIDKIHYTEIVHHV